MKCLYCNKLFQYPSKLRKHERIHTGEKPYKCETCGKLFTEFGNMKAHQRIHTGAKPYSCNQCEKSFAYRKDLHKHESVHTGKKHYKCETCEKSIMRESILEKNITVVRHVGNSFGKVLNLWHIVQFILEMGDTFVKYVENILKKRNNWPGTLEMCT